MVNHTSVTPNIIIALDGPAGSGKSTTARNVAGQLGYLYIDTGAMYRAITLAAMREGLVLPELYNNETISPLLGKYSVRLSTSDSSLTPDMFGGQRTFLNDEDVSEEIRSLDVTTRVSAISAIPTVREAMVQQQRVMGLTGGVVMDGRDIGTVVFPEAELKIFLVASVEERARRRLKELIATGGTRSSIPSLEELCMLLNERDRQDSERMIAPLRKAPDAIEIDTSLLTIDEQTEKILTLARAVTAQTKVPDTFSQS